ncbi:MAG TPA: 2-phosphosulfolactate phosphatase [Longimicrobiales bacterium]|nr:2-phosphosulfolactate phosphatase [Longimicrobiales bacterium]
MRLDVYFTPAELGASDLEGRTAVVIDVLRATSTIIEALANGARAVCPAGTTDEAVVLAQKLGREHVLLCGERKSLKIPGFDLGNSPLEFTAEQVAGKTLVMSTTNGTPALLAASGARRVLVAGYLNLSAVARELAEEGEAVSIVCAGRERRFALEDAVCAGHLALALREQLGRGLVLNDAGAVAVAMARGFGRSPLEAMRRTAAARQLVEAGLGADVEFCAAVDRVAIVPEFRQHQITVAG